MAFASLPTGGLLSPFVLWLRAPSTRSECHCATHLIPRCVHYPTHQANRRNVPEHPRVRHHAPAGLPSAVTRDKRSVTEVGAPPPPPPPPPPSSPPPPPQTGGGKKRGGGGGGKTVVETRFCRHHIWQQARRYSHLTKPKTTKDARGKGSQVVPNKLFRASECCALHW